MAVFLLMNLCVVACAYMLVSKVFKFTSVLDGLVALFIFYLSQIIITELALGILGKLYLGNLLVLNLAVLIVLLVSTRNQKGCLGFKGTLVRADEILKSRVALFVICAISAFGSAKIIINLINPPFGWDSLNYHFTFAVEWLKHGNLNIPIVPSDDPSPSYYPINGSLFYLWLVFPLKSVFLADLGQVPFFAISCFAVYAISRKINLSSLYSFCCAGLFLLIPNFFKQLRIAYVDVMVAALFLACVNSLFLLEKEFSWRNSLIFSLGLGLFIGVKTTALPFSLLLFAPFLWFWIKKSKNASLLLASLALAIFLGGYTYIRNFIECGNPFYPLDVTVLGNRVFKGVIEPAIYRVHFILKDYSLTQALFHEGLGLQALLFILPAGAAAPVF
ncbi:MAG: hypothetical protein AB1481_02480, partial [Candidatus Omnitrophota bacterium]